MNRRKLLKHLLYILFGLFCLMQYSDQCMTSCTCQCPSGESHFPKKKADYKKNTTSTCQCFEKEEEQEYIKCTKAGLVIGKGKWGFRNCDGQFESHVCPFGYCECKSENDETRKNEVLKYLNKTLHHTIFRPYSCLILTNTTADEYCIPSRTGKLCSECKPGLSVQFGTETCEECNTNAENILIILSCGLVLSAFITLFLRYNFDAFAGYLNAYLYSYQMMMLFIPEHTKLDPFILFIIFISGLSGTGGNVGICFYDGMNNLDKMVINYLLPTYMLLFTVIMGVFIPETWWKRLFVPRTQRRSIEESSGDIRRKSFGRSISFIIVYVYSSFTTITLDLMDRVDIRGKDVVYKAAFQIYLEPPHIYYWILALFIFIFVVVLFPVVLCFTPFIARKFPCIQMHRYEPIINALKDCFKDNLRWFSVFYFVCRLILFTIALYIKNEVTRISVFSGVSVIFLAVFSIFKPYKKRTFNCWDILLLTNLVLIGNLSSVIRIPASVSPRIHENMNGILYALVYVPLISVIARFIAYLYRKYLRNSQPESLELPSRNGIMMDRLRRWKRIRTKCSLGARPRGNSVRIPERIYDGMERSDNISNVSGDEESRL